MPYEPDFTSDVTGSVARLAPVRFTYTGSVDPLPVGYLWDFGDGITSNYESPTVYWRDVGNKTVRLTVIYDDDVQETEEKADYLEVVLDVQGDYLDLMLYQYKARDTVRNLLSPFIDQVTILDHVCAKLALIWSLSGRGVALDVIGDLLGLPRLGRDDDDYAEALRWMPYINHGYGQLGVIIQYIDLFLTYDHLFVSEWCGLIYVDVVISISQNYTLFLQRLQTLAAAGVLIHLAASDLSEIPVEFEYLTELPTYIDGNELSEIDYEDNGHLAELY
jgi:PKD repeat protein